MVGTVRMVGQKEWQNWQNGIKGYIRTIKVEGMVGGMVGKWWVEWWEEWWKEHNDYFFKDEWGAAPPFPTTSQLTVHM